jgi:tetratricopeptide (TPR) repeat protein
MLAAALLVAFASASAPPDAGADLWAVGRRLEAIETWQRALAQAPQDSALRRRLVEAQLAVHHYAAALENAAALGAEADRERALALYRLGRWEEALQHLGRDDELQVLMRIEALEALARSEESEREVERAAQLLGEDDVRVLGFRARAQARKGDDAAALALYRRAHELDPWDPAALFGLGRALVAVGEREQGLEMLRLHRELTPKLDALDFAQRGVDLAPLHAANHAGVGDAERDLGRTELALAAYERAYGLATPDELAPIALRLARLLAEDLGRTDGAVELLEEAGARCDDVRLWVRAGDLLREDGRPMEAIQRYLKARELRPDDDVIQRRIDETHASYRKEPRR